MPLILIGSRAAKINKIDLNRSTDNSDYDIVGLQEEISIFEECGFSVSESNLFPGKFTLRRGKEKIEFDATGNPSNLILFEMENLFFKDTIISENIEVLVADITTLYLTKRAHANFAIHFDKTYSDLEILSKVISQFTPFYSYIRSNPEAGIYFEYYFQRHKEAKERFGKRQERIKLNKSNDEFFRGGANLRTYVHDDLHRAVAFYPNSPMFELCKRDLNSAKIERDLFEALSFGEQIAMVQEESMVIGLERFGQKFEKETSDREGKALFMYRFGRSKLTRDLCKGWFQDFILDNVSFLQKPKWDYIAQFEGALKAGKINLV